MKIVLSLIICMYQGYNDSLQLLGIMGDDYINNHKIFIKFICNDVPDKMT